ncbi:MAG: CDP-diacylglycerol--glycerol-3-phosphate 3-phosphatidyltransferase [Lachnospiraceae bacterium]|nr:CDP-diacylglycerol--glycerol-3-phosphate 3-phosphatidyltransferase [Lachnospiraceae bacterium]
MNLPNRLTVLRVILVPVFVVIFLLKDSIPYGKYIAAAVFIIAAVTDLFDGMLARKLNLVTNFGKFMDPLADKLLVCSALICLVRFGLVPVWAVLIIVAREFIISGFRLVAAEQGIVLAASPIAKLKTNFQIYMTVALILKLPYPFFTVLEQILIWIAVILTVVSLADYLIKNRKVLAGGL